MDRKRIAKMSAGYTFFEVLISTALLLLLTAACASAYTVFYRGRMHSDALMQESYSMLKAALYVRKKTAELKIPYWENPAAKVNKFGEVILTQQPVKGVVFTKTEYLFDTSKRLRGLEFYYTAAAHTDEHRIKCLFSFVPVIPFQKGE